MAYADMVISNGKVLTVDKDFSIKEAIAVKDGMIIEVGNTDDIKKHVGPQTNVIDLEGKTILPGAHDAHMHGLCLGFIMSPSIVNLFFTKSLKQMKEQLAAKVKTVTPGTWIIGGGWNTLQMEEFAADPKLMLTKHDIDDVTPDNPVYLIDYSSHVLLVNSKALEIAGVDKNTPKPDPGTIVKDTQTGEPTGLLLDYAAEVLVTKHAPLPTYEEIKQNILISQSEYVKNGITSHMDIMGVGGDYLMNGMYGSRCIDVYHQLSQTGELKCRVSIGVWPFIDGVHGYERCVKGLEITKLPEENNWLKFWLKIWGDGMPQSFNAWMWQDQIYGHHGHSTFPGATDEEQYEDFLKTIKYLHKKGWQIGTHACGDRMVDKTLDAYITAMEEFPREDPRHYIIHAELTTPQQAKRAAAHRIGFSVQPTVDGLLHPAYEDMKLIWGKDGNMTAEDMSAYKTFIESGVNIAGGSDCPVTMPNWRQAIQDAVTRTNALGKTYNLQNSITVEDGIRMFTINGAIQEKMEHVRGSIEEGKFADFQVLGEDILTTDVDKIGQIPVLMTIVNGTVVHAA